MSPLVFFHIPKTAGSSFHDILADLYPKERSFSVTGGYPMERLEELKRLPEEELQELSLLKGHLLLNADRILGKQCVYLSFFRDPIQRTVSSFHYIKRAGHNRFHEEVKGLRLREFPAFLIEKKWNDLQTRNLVTPPEKLLHEEERDPLPDLRIYGVEEAVRILHEKIDHPLITEEFDRSLVYLARELDWPYVPTPPVKNASGSKEVKRLGQRTLGELEKVNELDLELYEKAKAIFYRNLEAVWDDAMEKELYELQDRKKAGPSSSPGFFERLKKKLWS